MRAPAALKKQVAAALAACEDKKAADVTVLEMEKNAGVFTDYFVICSGSNPRQIQAIADDIRERLEATALAPKSVEGYALAEWVLMDYVDFVVHIFSENARRLYDLERLWKSAKRLTPADVVAPAKRAVGSSDGRGRKSKSAAAGRAAAVKRKKKSTKLR